MGIGIAHSYYFNTGWLFPINENSNSTFSRLNSKIELGNTDFHLTGTYSLYYVPPLFRKYYSQKNLFHTADIGIAYEFENDLNISIVALTSLNSPFHEERLSRPLGFVDEPNLEITGIAIRISKSIF